MTQHNLIKLKVKDLMKVILKMIWSF